MQVFAAWKLLARRKIKLRRLLKTDTHEKSAQLSPLSIDKKLLEVARRVRTKLLHRRDAIRKETKLYWVLKANLALMCDVYTLLRVPESGKLYIAQQDRHLFECFIVPFVGLFTSTPLSLSSNC